jgi:hypothetical protein
MDDYPICPDWWPKILWDLHFRSVPWERHIIVNYPPPTEAILTALLAHTSSYLILDKKAAADIRAAAVKGIIEAATNLDRLHDEHVANAAKTNKRI